MELPENEVGSKAVDEPADEVRCSTNEHKEEKELLPTKAVGGYSADHGTEEQAQHVHAPDHRNLVLVVADEVEVRGHGVGELEGGVQVVAYRCVAGLEKIRKSDPVLY